MLAGDDPHQVLVDFCARMKDSKHHPNAVGVQFVQIGNDPGADTALKKLMQGDVNVSLSMWCTLAK